MSETDRERERETWTDSVRERVACLLFVSRFVLAV